MYYAKVEIMITTTGVRGEAQKKDNQECESKQDSQCINEDKGAREEEEGEKEEEEKKQEDICDRDDEDDEPPAAPLHPAGLKYGGLGFWGGLVG